VTDIVSAANYLYISPRDTSKAEESGSGVGQEEGESNVPT